MEHRLDDHLDQLDREAVEAGVEWQYGKDGIPITPRDDLNIVIGTTRPASIHQGRRHVVVNWKGKPYCYMTDLVEAGKVADWLNGRE